MEKDSKRIPRQLLTKIKNTLFRTRRRTIITAILVLIAGFSVWQIFGQQQKQQQYQTAQVERGSIISTVSESGNVSGNQTNITSPTNGVIEELYVKNGDQILIGQNLFKVKSTATQQDQATAYANYLTAQNTLNTAKAKMNSLQSALFKANQTFITDKGIINPSDQQKADPKYIEENADWLQAESDYNNQKGVIAQAQAALQSAALAYQATQDAVVIAPVAGTVANVSVTVGSSVTATNNTSSTTSSTTGSSTTTGSTVLLLTNPSALSVKAQVSEVDAPKLKQGQKATITLDAFPGKTFVGSVDQMDTVGTVNSGVVTYTIYITFVAPPSTIQSGMSATVNIQTARKDDVLTVPLAAVQKQGNQSVVRVLKNGNITQVPVETGLASDTQIEIASGLSEGDTVVTSVVSQNRTGQTTSPFGAFGSRGFGGGALRGGGGR